MTIDDIANTNLTGRERMLAIVATNSTTDITPSLFATLTQDSKK
jgi:hypothetical protein